MLNGIDDSTNGHYTWRSSQPWVTVNAAGNVSFNSKPLAGQQSVTLTASPLAGGLTYTYTLSSWYVNNGTTLFNWNDANAWAKSQSGTLPTVQQLNGSTLHSDGVRGTLGGLWSEWGGVGGYPESGFISYNYWTSEASGVNQHYFVYLNSGYARSNDDANYYYAVSRQGLF